MDYKYIEQLLERYFDCLTTLGEEQILRSFFSQENVPIHLMQYRELFVFLAEAKELELGEDFDERLLSAVEDVRVKASREGKTFSFRRQFAPLFRAAAIVAVILSVGNIMEHSMVGVESDCDADGATAVNPYIKAADIPSVITIKDVSRAEAMPQSDSIPVISGDNGGEKVQ